MVYDLVIKMGCCLTSGKFPLVNAFLLFHNKYEKIPPPRLNKPLIHFNIFGETVYSCSMFSCLPEVSVQVLGVEITITRMREGFPFLKH